MSSKYKFRNPDGIYLVSISVVGWMDVFTRNTYKDILLDSIRHCQKEKALIVHAWVLMTSHIHLIISKKRHLPSRRNHARHEKIHCLQLIGAIMDNIQESRKERMLRLFEEHGKANPDNTKFQFWQHHNIPSN